ncbi:MAG: gamma-glutamyltransferase [Magnetovibrionaceae bacterium]
MAFSLLIPVETALAQDKSRPEGRSTPEAASQVREDQKTVVQSKVWMAVTANPLASQAAADVLTRGGSAVDAAIAAQMVLNVVEPQSSGIGGGGFLLHYEARGKRVTSYDGRETAPAAATPERFLKPDGQPMGFFEALVGGRSVGVPGLVALLGLAHAEHGQLPWAELFEPAIRLAREGFRVSPRLAGLIARDKHLGTFETTRALFYHPDGTPLKQGQILKNETLARVFTTIAEQGPGAFYTGWIAEDIVRHVTSARQQPGDLTLDDLAAYKATKREPVCGFYRGSRVCGMGPPSSGATTVLQILGLLEAFPPDALKPGTLGRAHLLSEAGKLAFADRGAYLGDADFVEVPVEEMLARDYLADRSKLIDPTKAMEKARPGLDQDRAEAEVLARGLSTTHLSIVDSEGNAVAMTTSIENAFGSRLVSNGFLLNNQLTDFAFRPRDDAGILRANAVAPNKRPRSSMAPTLVLDEKGTLIAATGSPGGSSIIGYVAGSLSLILDHGFDPQAAVNAGHVVNRNGPTDLEQGTEAEALQPGLEALGHKTRVRPMTSGLHIILHRGGILSGGADPRREGLAIGGD